MGHGGGCGASQPRLAAQGANEDVYEGAPGAVSYFDVAVGFESFDGVVGQGGLAGDGFADLSL